MEIMFTIKTMYIYKLETDSSRGEPLKIKLTLFLNLNEERRVI